jgi:MraZ protein
MKATFLFLDTTTNKVDAKGRVSLPADYRTILKELSTDIVCYRSLTSPCIEGCTEDLLEKLATDIENSTDFFSETQDDLTNLIFGDAKCFIFDSTGRITLTEKLLRHAEITDTAVFVGKGRKFQIWSEKNWIKEEERLREKVKRNRPMLHFGEDK